MRLARDREYDVVLANGRVIDPETYLDGTFNVGINGGQIAAISDQLADDAPASERLNSDLYRPAEIHEM